MGVNLNKEYPAIRAWGEHLGSMAYYIKDQQQSAMDDDAPPNAIYKDVQLNQWRVVEDVKDLALRDWLFRRIDSLTGG